MRNKNYEVKMDDKGRVMIPIEMRREMGIGPTDKLQVQITKNGGVEFRKDMTAAKLKLAKDILKTAPKDATFIVNGSYVVCVTKERFGSGYRAKTGTAMCNPCDEFHIEIGKAIALLYMQGENLPALLNY